MDEIDAACQEAVNGLPSRRPIIEMTIPSVLDKTISPPGTQTLPYMHLMLLDDFLSSPSQYFILKELTWVELKSFL